LHYKFESSQSIFSVSIQNLNIAMKFQRVIILFLIFVASVTSMSQDEYETAAETTKTKRELSKAEKKVFRKWMKKHRKDYKSSEEELIALEKWLVNKKIIDEHNKLHDSGKVSYRLNLNPYSDLTGDEWKKTMTGLTIKSDSKIRNKRELTKADFPAGPASVNWTEQVGPVENQGACGSCWAFSAAGVVNAALRRRNSSTTILVSPQQMLDCDNQEGGCGGGWPPHAVDYAVANGIDH
jgi:C1A family cysteine protease